MCMQINVSPHALPPPPGNFSVLRSIGNLHPVPGTARSLLPHNNTATEKCVDSPH